MPVPRRRRLRPSRLRGPPSQCQRQRCESAANVTTLFVYSAFEPEWSRFLFLDISCSQTIGFAFVREEDGTYFTVSMHPVPRAASCSNCARSWDT